MQQLMWNQVFEVLVFKMQRTPVKRPWEEEVPASTSAKERWRGWGRRMSPHKLRLRPPGLKLTYITRLFLTLLQTQIDTCFPPVVTFQLPWGCLQMITGLPLGPSCSGSFSILEQLTKIVFLFIFEVLLYVIQKFATLWTSAALELPHRSRSDVYI